MNVRKINPDNEIMRPPTRSYSQGVVIPIGDVELMFITGQVAQDANGVVMYPGDTERQTRVVFDRLKAILQEAEMDFINVVKVQIFVKDMKESSKVSAIRNDVFKDINPVSTMIEVSGYAKEDCMIEIEVTAVKKKD